MTEGHCHTGGRRKNQDYSTCLAFLPEGVWSRILKAPSDRLRADELAYFLYTVLQLRLPTEYTYAVLTGVLASFDPKCTSFDLRTKLQTVKTAWSNMKTRLSRDHADPPELLLKLPGTFDDLTDELRARFGQTRPLDPWPIIHRKWTGRSCEFLFAALVQVFSKKREIQWKFWQICCCRDRRMQEAVATARVA